MNKPIELSKIIDCLEDGFEEYHNYLNKETAEIVFLSSEEMRAAEDDEPLDRFPEWQQEVINNAIDLFENPQNYISLPDQYDVHEWKMMETFALSLQDEKISNSLYNAIHRKGAFRRFKDLVFSHGVRDKWFDFRDKQYKKIAIEWCEAHDIPYIDQ